MVQIEGAVLSKQGKTLKLHPRALTFHLSFGFTVCVTEKIYVSLVYGKPKPECPLRPG